MNKDKESPATPAQEVVHQPVAYDAEGRPLYAHPPAPAQAQTVVHVARPIEPKAQAVSPDLQRRHDRSKLLYPLLNLSPGEYVISAVRRHPIGLIIPLGIGTLLIAMALSILFNLDVITVNMSVAGPFSDPSMLVVPLWIFTAIVALGMFIAYYVYVNNKFFLTNESVIQEIQVSLFSRQEQTVSLANIEDASYTQHGIVQHIFDYGNIRLSTEGEETTYRFSYVASPKGHIARLNNAVEAFKNGRPVEDN